MKTLDWCCHGSSHLLEVMIDDEEDEFTEDDRQAIRSSREYFQENPDGGLSFEDMVAGCGFTMDQIRKVG